MLRGSTMASSWTVGVGEADTQDARNAKVDRIKVCFILLLWSKSCSCVETVQRENGTMVA